MLTYAGKIHELGELLEKRLPSFERSTLLEVQERACMCHHILGATYAHVCSRMLTYAHVCSRMLTYAELLDVAREAGIRAYVC
jgi:hypothetical protein